MPAGTADGNEKFVPRQSSGGNEHANIPWWALAQSLPQRLLRRLPTLPGKETVRGVAKSKQLKSRGTTRGAYVKEPRVAQAPAVPREGAGTRPSRLPSLRTDDLNKSAEKLGIGTRFEPRPGIVKFGITQPTGARSVAKATQQSIVYITREGAGIDGTKAKLLDKEGEADAKAFLGRVREGQDEHGFRLILSFDATDAKRVDMAKATRDFMGRVEKALGTHIDWVASSHYDTDNPHSHVLLRGKDLQGRALLLDRDFVSKGARFLAQETITGMLGPKTIFPEKSLAQEQGKTPARVFAVQPAMRLGLTPAGSIAQKLVKALAPAKAIVPQKLGPELDL